ncbi:NAD(P)-binding protein [Trichoderma novae-zelandiae]
MATTMQAWTFSRRGSPSDVLSLTSSQPFPAFPPGAARPEEWILIKVAFAGLNVGAIFQMTLIPALLRSKTCVPEMDLSGIVQDVWHPHVETSSGEDAATGVSPGSAESSTQTRFRRGDKVMAMLPASHALPTGTGALAEYVAIPARLAMVESGARPGDRVLVNAASGGIGTMVVQMARRTRGASSSASAAAETPDWSRASGPTRSSTTPSTTTSPPISPAASAPVPSTPWATSPSTSARPDYLVPSGTYSSVGIRPPGFLRAVWQMKRNEWWPVTRWLGGDRRRIADLLGGGHVRVVRDSVWWFEDVREAYARLGGAHASGKVLVKVDERVGDDEC